MKDKFYSDLTTPLAQSIADTFDAPIEAILDAELDADGNIYGQLLSGGNIYEYQADSYAVEIEYSPEETAEINSYAQVILDNLGIRVDSIYSPFEYVRGLPRMDVGQVQCKSGNIPCGRKCLPRGQKCRKGMGAASAGVNQAKANLSRNKGRGGFGKVALTAGLTAAGAAIAGGLTAAALSKKNKASGWSEVMKGREEIDKGWDELVDQSADLKRRASGSR